MTDFRVSQASGAPLRAAGSTVGNVDPDGQLAWLGMLIYLMSCAVTVSLVVLAVL